MERQSAREQRSMTLKAFHLRCQAGTRQEDPLFLVIPQVGCIYTVTHTCAIVLDCKLRKDEHTCVSGICREWFACKVQAPVLAPSVDEALVPSAQRALPRQFRFTTNYTAANSMPLIQSPVST